MRVLYNHSGRPVDAGTYLRERWSWAIWREAMGDQDPRYLDHGGVKLLASRVGITRSYLSRLIHGRARTTHTMKAKALQQLKGIPCLPPGG